MTQGTVFKSWGKKTSKRQSLGEPSRKDRAVLVGVNPKLKQIAFDRLAILRNFYCKSSQPGKLKTKAEVMKNFLNEFNSGVLWPEGGGISVRHVGRATLYNWRRLYANGGLAGLVPHYRVKHLEGRATFRPLKNPIEMKFAGRPRRNGKKDFTLRVKRHWKFPPLTCPVRLSIFYSFPIPKKTKMKRRMRMIRHQISHVGKPNLDALNSFTIGCMLEIVFKNHSQIVDFRSQKQWSWWPEIRILITTLSG
jgi:Holliday junction resolvase RusA-like endonuclease